MLQNETTIAEYKTRATATAANPCIPILSDHIFLALKLRGLPGHLRKVLTVTPSLMKLAPTHLRRYKDVALLFLKHGRQNVFSDETIGTPEFTADEKERAADLAAGQPQNPQRSQQSAKRRLLRWLRAFSL